MSNLKYGLTVVGKIRVFAKEKTIQGRGKKQYTITDYWFNVSEKNPDDTWTQKSVNLLFRKDDPTPDSNQVIVITNAFPVLTGEGDWLRVAYFVDSWEPEVIS